MVEEVEWEEEEAGVAVEDSVRFLDFQIIQCGSSQSKGQIRRPRAYNDLMKPYYLNLF